jgi:Beige/BEACH domain
VLANYESDEIPDLSDKRNFRDLTKPVGALNPTRLAEFRERFESFVDPSIPPFMYGSHYSTSAGVVLHFLLRLHPYADLHRQLQSGHFDVADRLFNSVPRAWKLCTGRAAAEVKELTPEWYCNPSFLRNSSGFYLGTSQDGEEIGDVELPPWAKGSPERFVEVMRAALESEHCSEMLPDWIDLIFGKKQQGPESVKANNVFFYLTYFGSVDVASIKDDALRHATELQIAHFGQW